MTPANFARCLATHVVGQDGDLLQVSVPSTLELHWFDTRIRRRVEEAVAARGHSTVRIQFVITHPARTSTYLNRVQEGGTRKRRARRMGTTPIRVPSGKCSARQ
ncbi:MAG TPA: hypothetical protein VNL71_16175, partial [Chloroflexota bacterium]|nr:hypothetical protein [Chloroflexota bacterium]